jgi:hypothetical protein
MGGYLESVGVERVEGLDKATRYLGPRMEQVHL